VHCRFSLSGRGLSDRLRHLTNCSVQVKESRRGAEAAGELLWSSGRFRAWLGEHGYGARAWEERVLPAIAGVARATVASAHGDWHADAADAPRRACFEVFGLDVILDEGLRPWLLEVNASPNLRDHGAETLEPMLGSLLDIVLAEGDGDGDALPVGGPTAVGAWRRM
jgi:hypothetical protein